MPKIIISAKQGGPEHNATPTVIEAVGTLRRAGGGTLLFEKGEYHFYDEGTEKIYYAVSNNATGEKHIVFPLQEMNHITVDGGNSSFVIHGKIFPFAIDHCQHVTVKNIYFDRSTSPMQP